MVVLPVCGDGDGTGGGFTKYAVGYQIRPSGDLVDAILSCREAVSEVYFSWGVYPNGRNAQTVREDFTEWEAQRRQEEDLRRLAGAGIRFNLLFNAMCYGRDSQSRAFFEGIGDTVDYVSRTYGLAAVTTTSPLIAKFVRDNFKGIDVRASVNMGIGTPDSMDCVRDYFDSFYMKRELNRDFTAIRRLKEWCVQNGKTLYALANSGCLNDCPVHVFHDNLVAHEREIAQMDNGYAFEGICRAYLSDPEKRAAVLAQTSFIRPEDVRYYEELFPAMKLATRVSRNPAGILRAYVKQTYTGSVTSLLEPDHSGILYPYLLENSRIRSSVQEGKLIYMNAEEAWIRLEDTSIC